jgi:hypothetical protein
LGLHRQFSTRHTAYPTATRLWPPDSVRSGPDRIHPRIERLRGSNAATQAARGHRACRTTPQTSDPNLRREGGREGGNLTIPVLVEEAEGLLELGDLVVGELIRHEPGGGEGSNRGNERGIKEGKEWEAMDADATVWVGGGRKARSVQWRGVRRNFPTPDLYALPLDAAVTFGTSKSPNYPRAIILFPIITNPMFFPNTPYGYIHGRMANEN